MIACMDATIADASVSLDVSGNKDCSIVFTKICAQKIYKVSCYMTNKLADHRLGARRNPKSNCWNKHVANMFSSSIDNRESARQSRRGSRVTFCPIRQHDGDDNGLPRIGCAFRAWSAVLIPVARDTHS